MASQSIPLDDFNLKTFLDFLGPSSILTFERVNMGLDKARVRSHKKGVLCSRISTLLPFLLAQQKVRYQQASRTVSCATEFKNHFTELLRTFGFFFRVSRSTIFKERLLQVHKQVEARNTKLRGQSNSLINFSFPTCLRIYNTVLHSLDLVCRDTLKKNRKVSKQFCRSIIKLCETTILII